MRSALLRCITALALLSLLTLPVSARPYRMIDLGTLGGSDSYAYGINDYGQIVGGSKTSSGQINAFLYAPGKGMSNLGNLDGRPTYGYSINNYGQIVGTANLTDSYAYPCGAFTYTTETGMSKIADLDGIDSAAFDINDSGVIVGYYMSQNVTGAAWAAFTYSADKGLCNVFGYSSQLSSCAHAISETGLIAGWKSTWGPETAYVTMPGTYIGTLGGDVSVALDVNSVGQTVGYSTPHYFSSNDRAFLYTPEVGIRDLGTLGGVTSIANGINSLGQVVGNADTARAGISHAFVYTSGGGMVDLRPLARYSSWASGINNAGQIVGWAEISTGVRHAVMWEIVPEPTSLLTLGAGLVLLAGIIRRKR